MPSFLSVAGVPGARPAELAVATPSSLGSVGSVGRHMFALAHAPDRRQFPRFEADIPAIASLVDNSETVSLRARCDGISEGGISAPGLNLLSLGDLVTLELNIPGATQPIRVDAVVRHDTRRCGLEFLSLSEYQRNRVKGYCRLQKEEKRQN